MCVLSSRLRSSLLTAAILYTTSWHPRIILRSHYWICGTLPFLSPSWTLLGAFYITFAYLTISLRGSISSDCELLNQSCRTGRAQSATSPAQHVPSTLKALSEESGLAGVHSSATNYKHNPGTQVIVYVMRPVCLIQLTYPGRRRRSKRVRAGGRGTQNRHRDPATRGSVTGYHSRLS